MPSNPISRGVRIPQRLRRVQRGFRRQLGTYKSTYLASVNGTPRAANGYWWVHDRSGVDANGNITYGAPYKLSMLAGAAISRRPNTRVDTITRNGVTYITGSDPEELRRMGVDLHQTNPIDPSARFKVIEDLSNLQSFPDPAGNSGTVRVWAGMYRKSDGSYAKFAGQSGIDILTGYTPSTDMQKVVCLWLDETDNSITTTASSELSRDTFLNLNSSTAITYINECAEAAPYGAIGITAYIIYDDTTSIGVLNKFEDLRGIIGSGNGGSGGGGLGYPDPVTSNLVIADGKALLVDSGLTISTGGGVSLGAGSAVKMVSTRRIDSVISVSTNYNMTRNDDRLLVDASGGAVTITLPDATRAYQGHLYSVKATDVSGGYITLDPFGSQTINGDTSKTITSATTGILFYSDGSNLYIT